METYSEMVSQWDDLSERAGGGAAGGAGRRGREMAFWTLLDTGGVYDVGAGDR